MVDFSLRPRVLMLRGSLFPHLPQTFGVGVGVRSGSRSACIEAYDFPRQGSSVPGSSTCECYAHYCVLNFKMHGDER